MLTRPEGKPGPAPALASLLCLALATALPAQPDQPFVDFIDVQVVEVDVVVTDRKGRPVDGLKPEDFELYVDSAPVQITNFYESRVLREQPVGDSGDTHRSNAERASGPGSSDDAALTIVFYLDDASTLPSHRTRLLGRLEHAVAPWRSMEARFMLARFDHRLDVLVPPTRDLDAILEGAATVPKGSPRAIQNVEGARRSAIRSLIDSHEACLQTLYCRPCQDNWGELLSLARQHADNQAANAAIAADGLADLVTTLAGVPGKKAVVYVTDGLPQRPGISVLDYLGNQLCPDLRRSASSETMAEILQYDESRRFNRVTAHANANRVTFFALDAAGLRDATPDISLDRTTAPSSRNLNLYNMNAQSGLHLVASETGGKALLNANDLTLLLADVSAQLAVSYSLGFAPTAAKPGEIRQLQVDLAGNAAKGRTVEYRRSYRDKSVDERLAERLLSVAYLGSAENPLEARVGFGASEALGKDAHALAVTVGVPAEAILALPFRGEETGQLRLWLLAVREDDGARTKVRQKSLPVGGGSGVAAIDGAYRFEVAMNLPEGAYQVAVGVRDETTGVTSLIREPVSLPTPKANASARP